MSSQSSRWRISPTDLDAEVTATRLTMYAAPDDDLAGEMYVYTADVG